MTAASKPRMAVAAVPLGLSAAAVSAPLLSVLGQTLAAFAVFQFFSVVCHQDPVRSFWIAGAPVAVCTRCLGIYLGAVAGAWVRATRRTTLALLAVAVVVSVLDYLAESAGLHGDLPWIRFALGAALGALLGALVIESLQHSLRRNAAAPAGSD